MCSILPGDRVMGGGVTFEIGDVDRMVEAALMAAMAGRHVFVEWRTVRPGNPGERGKLAHTAGVFAFVIDRDGAPAKPAGVSMVMRLSWSRRHPEILTSGCFSNAHSAQRGQNRLAMRSVKHPALTHALTCRHSLTVYQVRQISRTQRSLRVGAPSSRHGCFTLAIRSGQSTISTLLFRQLLIRS